MYCAQSLSTFQVSSSKNKYKCVSLLQYVMLVLCGCFHLQLQTLQPIHCVTTVMLSVSTMLETQLGSVGGKSLICYSVPAPCRCVVATSQILCLLYELCVVWCVLCVSCACAYKTNVRIHEHMWNPLVDANVHTRLNMARQASVDHKRAGLACTNCTLANHSTPNWAL